MKYVELTKGYKAMVDDEDYDRVNAKMWHVRKMSNSDIRYALHGFWEGKKMKRIWMQ